MELEVRTLPRLFHKMERRMVIEVRVRLNSAGLKPAFVDKNSPKEAEWSEFLDTVPRQGEAFAYYYQSSVDEFTAGSSSEGLRLCKAFVQEVLWMPAFKNAWTRKVPHIVLTDRKVDCG